MKVVCFLIRGLFSEAQLFNDFGTNIAHDDRKQTRPLFRGQIEMGENEYMNVKARENNQESAASCVCGFRITLPQINVYLRDVCSRLP